MSKEDIALGMLALKHAMDRIKPAQDALRAQARDLMAKKERVAVVIDGEVIGTISKSKPSRKARVTDPVAFQAWVTENYPDHVKSVSFIEDVDAVKFVVREHAPHLLHYREEVDPSLANTVLEMSEETGVPTGPGGEADVPGVVVDTPDGVVSVHPEKDAVWMVEQLFTSGRVSLDGSVRKEIGQ